MLLSHCARWRRATCQGLWTPLIRLLTSALACRQPVASPVLPVPAGSGLCSVLDVPGAWALQADCVAASCAFMCGSVKAAALRAFSREAADKPRPGHKCRNSSRHTVSEVPTCTQFAQCSEGVNAVEHLPTKGQTMARLWLCHACVLPAVRQAHASSTPPCGCHIVNWPGGADSINLSRQAVL